MKPKKKKFFKVYTGPGFPIDPLLHEKRITQEVYNNLACYLLFKLIISKTKNPQLN